MLESWWIVAAAAILLLVAVNAAIFLFACYEYGTSPRKDPWLRCTHVLGDGAGKARPSVVLLHGFGGTPSDVRALAERLAAHGFRAVVPAIPEQTGTTFAYSRGRLAPADYADWLSGLIKEETAAGGQPPILVGFSMGGTLAALAAAEHAVARLVLISPYFDLPATTRRIAGGARWLRWIVPVVPKVAKGQIVDRAGYREYATGSYLISMRAVLRLAEVAALARAKAARLTLPVLVFASEKDSVASFDVTEGLFRELRNARLVACNRSNHIVTYDFDRERVITEVLAFLTSPTPLDLPRAET